MSLSHLGAEAAIEPQAMSTPETKPRRGRWLPWLAWSIWLVSLIFLALSLFLPWLTDPATLVDNLLVIALGLPAVLAYATVGALIASRRPENPIGWLFGAAAFLVTMATAAEEYARYALLTRPGSLPGGLLASWFRSWMLGAGLLLMFTFLLLLFPNGKLPSARWRIVGRVVAMAVCLVTALDAFSPGPVAGTLHVNNPVGLPIAEDVAALVQDPLILLSIVVCGISVIARFRGSKGDERLQLKWFAYAAALSMAQFAVSYSLALYVPGDSLQPVRDVLLMCSLATFPIAAGIAILKYHLYRIDLIVNRTLVYVPLTAILAGVCSASIGISQRLFIAATGQQSDAALVLSTLLVVASFEPIKRALQTVVDKRFKETPDPTKHLKAFGREVSAFLDLNSAERLTSRLLDEVLSSFGARAGAIYLGHNGLYHIIHASQEWTGETEMSAPLTAHAERIGLVCLSERRNGLAYTDQDKATLQTITDVVAQAIELAEHRREPVAD
ncbi:MAG: hypothetical protein QOH93_2499 [Chloroflexia bacterium]|jgi:hypothetical protein|nr:hypothetical protein [Chloroflexia bacterium]